MKRQHGGGRKQTNPISLEGMTHPDQKPQTFDIFGNTFSHTPHIQSAT